MKTFLISTGKPLYLRIGEVINGTDRRAEVGLLIRNVLPEGEMEDSCQGRKECCVFSFGTSGGHVKRE